MYNAESRVDLQVVSYNIKFYSQFRWVNFA